MARVLCCWELGNGLAYIEGLAAGAAVIAAGGHEVQFALRDLTHAERLLGGKFRFHQAPTTVIPPNTRLPNPMTFADVLINLGYGNPGAVTARVRAWRNLIDDVKPDVLRCAHAPGAMLAARGTPLRTVAGGIGFLVPPPVSPLPLLRHWAKNAVPARMAAREQQVLDGMNRALDAIGAPRVASIGALYEQSDVLELYTYPEMDDYGPRQGVKYLGNLQSAQGHAPEWPMVPGKKIFAYLEPFRSIEVVLEALADTGQAVLVYMAHAPQELLSRYAKGNLRITGQPLNLPETARRCDVGVSHGGHNIAGTFFGAGKPQLAIPTLFPERVTAEKIAALGAGRVSRVNKAELQRNLTELLEDASITDAARTCAGRVANLRTEAALQAGLASINEVVALGPKHW